MGNGLDRWWSTAEVAAAWGVTSKVAARRLACLDRELGGMLLRKCGEGAARRHVRVWGRALESAFPGMLSKVSAAAAPVTLLRIHGARLDELEGARNDHERGLDSHARMIERLCDVVGIRKAG